jgi:UMF1 family MFS transporter
MEQNNPKVMNAWAFYDWANSVYNLVITTAIFPIFYKAQAVHFTNTIDGKEVGFVNFWGIDIINTSLYGYVFAASFVVITLLMPLLSGIADYTDTRKRFLQFFCYLGATSCMALYFFDSKYIEISMLAPFFASIGFWGSLVFYNSYLPIIATPDKQDALSAKGFSLGYFGSVLLLVAILFMITTYGKHLTRYSFLAVGLWWAGFAQITYAQLPGKTRKHNKRKRSEILKSGYLELIKVWNELKVQKRLTRFLSAFFTFNTGVQTVLLLAVLFAEQEINWPIVDGEKDSSGLIISMILIQLVAILGALSMSRLSKWFSNIRVLQMCTALWITACVIAYFITEPVEFYFLAALVGFVMGGIQSLSRSTYSKMLPKTDDPTSYFSFYDVLEKIGLIIGPFLFATVNWITGGMRPSVLVVMTFFIIGFLLLFRVPKLSHKSA